MFDRRVDLIEVVVLEREPELCAEGVIIAFRRGDDGDGVFEVFQRVWSVCKSIMDACHEMKKEHC